jgi:hypothetical protein
MSWPSSTGWASPGSSAPSRSLRSRQSPLVTRSLRAQVQYLDMVLRDVAKRIQFPGKAKSLPLPSVTLARKAQPSRITITDPAALLAFAKANKLPVKTAESVAHADVVEYYEATGEVPPGCEYVESTDNPHVKF